MTGALNTAGGAYQPSSPQNSGFKGGIPKIFLVGGIPLVLFFMAYQCALGRYYTGAPYPKILIRAKRRINNIPVHDRLHDKFGTINGSGMDDFGVIAAEIQNGSLRRIKKTLKDLENESKSHRQQAAKDMFQNIVSEIENEVKLLEEKEASAKNGKPHLKQRSKPAWIWGPVVKEPSLWPKSAVLEGKNQQLIMDILEWEYNILEKEVPFVGSPADLVMHPQPDGDAVIIPRKYTNSLIVAPFADDQRKHGLVGINPKDGKQWWNPKPMPKICDEVGEEECKSRLKAGGGFDLTVSDARPLDTLPPINNLKENCQKYVEEIDIQPLPDASVVITFYNEPLSTLLRTVHSVLNNTPPSLLREIIMVDDHSDLEECLPGGPLDDAIKYLPKVKILRQPERRGLVMGRIAGIHNSLGTYWMEPMLQRILEEPKAVVYPIVAGIDQKTFEPITASGIGTWLSWTWQMVEASTYDFPPKSIDPVPSASMAGGLFAVRRDMFFELGAYDEQMAMWGAENVEMPFRVWQCGGRVEGIPCSMTYHIYRKGGTGYSSPSESIMMNRLRTARLWMDEWYQIARFFILFGNEDVEKEERIIGNMDEMLSLKKDLKCKGFDWFLENIDPTHAARNLDDVAVMGAIRSMVQPGQCLDMHGKKDIDDPIGTYNCHGQGSAQSWFAAPNMSDESGHSKVLVPVMNPKLCVNRLHPLDKEQKPIPDNFGKAGVSACNNSSDAWNLHVVDVETPMPKGLTKPEDPEDLQPYSVPGRLVQNDKNHPEYGGMCLTKIDDSVNVPGNIRYDKCDPQDLRQWWWIQRPKFAVEGSEAAGFKLPTISPDHLQFMAK